MFLNDQVVGSYHVDMARRKVTAAMSDLERVQLFLEVGDALLSRRVAREGLFRSSFNLHFEQGKGVSFSSQFPDEEDLRSFMLDLRKLTAPNSEVNFPRVMRSACVALTVEPDEKPLTTLPVAWRKALSSGQIELKVDGRVWTPSDLLDIWFNGELFHTDRDKAADWSRLSNLPFVKLLLVNTVSALTELTMHGMARIDYLLGGLGSVSIATGRARAVETDERDSVS